MTTFEKLVLTGLRLILWRLCNKSYGTCSDTERKWLAETHLEIEK